MLRKSKDIGSILRLSVVGLAFGYILACGVGRETELSNLQSGRVAVSTTVSSHLPTIYDSTSSGYWYRERLESLVKEVLAERLSNYNLVPSQLAEFFNFEVTLDQLEGCSGTQWYQVCRNVFSFDISMKVTGGPDTIDQVSRRVTFSSVDAAEMRRKIDWTIKLLLDLMVQHGTLAELGASRQTPWF